MEENSNRVYSLLKKLDQRQEQAAGEAEALKRNSSQKLQANNLTKLELTVADLAALVECLAKGKGHSAVGFEDAVRTYKQVLNILNLKVSVDKEVLESALWSANLLNDIGMFKHPLSTDFKQMVNRIVPKGYKFDETFNLIEKEDK